jgi:hypothetical protein
MGPIWMERTTGRRGELVVTERHRRRIIPGPRKRVATKKR